MVPSSLAVVLAIHSAGGDIGIFDKGGERVQTAVCICGKCGTPARGGCEKSAKRECGQPAKGARVQPAKCECGQPAMGEGGQPAKRECEKQRGGVQPAKR